MQVFTTKKNSLSFVRSRMVNAAAWVSCPRWARCMQAMAR